MSNRHKVYRKGNVEGAFTMLRHELLNSVAWKHMSPGARLLYIALLRRLNYKADNNGKIFLATRKAAEELGASQRIVCIWFRELEHYGFVAMTEPGSVGPKGRATRWRITDMAWGELDGKPIRSTKDYLTWTGELFQRQSEKQKNGEQKYSDRRPKVLTTDDQKYSAPPPSDDQRYSEGRPPDRERKYSDIDLPSPIPVTVLPPDDWRRNAKSPDERLEIPADDSIPPFLRRTLN
jgi:hypothetical protein